MLRSCAPLAIVLSICCVGGGCSSMKRTDTARTAREQLLISTAVDQSLNKVNFQAFSGKKVVVDDKYLECADKGYVTGSIRHRVAMAGGAIVPKLEDADVLLELRSGAVGTDNAESFLGTPALSMPGMISIPEIKLVSRTNQTAVAKIGLAAYDAKTMRLLGDGGTSLSMSTDNNWHLLGVGPYSTGTVHKEINRGIPSTAEQPYTELPTHVAFAAPQTAAPDAAPPAQIAKETTPPAGQPPAPGTPTFRPASGTKPVSP